MRKKSPRNNVYVGLFLILSAIGAIWLYTHRNSMDSAKTPEISFSKTEGVAPARLMDFNPNDLSQRQWEQLGFSEKQAQTILNYKKSLGGEFHSRQEFSRCYAVSPKKYEELRTYIILPEGSAEEQQPRNSFAANRNFPAYEKKTISVRGAFDPNALDAAGWEQMGFTPKQAGVIVNYRKMLGGTFTSAQQLADCYVISPEAFAVMKPYLKISAPPAAVAATAKTKPMRQLAPFDPNSLTKEGWMALGYSEKQAQSILNYKEKYLRGAFRSLEDVEKNFILKERFPELKPFLILPAAAVQVPTVRPIASTPAQVSMDFTGMDINAMTKEQLQQGGIAPYLAAGIVNYRKQLGGFADKKQLYEVYNIDRETAELLIQKTRLSGSAEKYTLLNAPEGWLKTHPYFRYHADKIIFYRISYPDQKKIWKLLNARPEQEAKMRMYLL